MLNPAMRSGFPYARGDQNYIAAANKSPREFLFGGRSRSRSADNDAAMRPAGSHRIRTIGLNPCFSLRRTKATVIYRRTGNLHAV